MIIQAVPSSWKHVESSELFQLPHFDSGKIKIFKLKKRTLKTVANLMDLSQEDRVTALMGVDFTPEQSKDVLAIGAVIPQVTIERAYFECVGEEIITPGSLVTFVMEVRAVHYGLLSNVSSKITSVIPEVAAPLSPVSVDDSDDDGFDMDDDDDDDEESDGPPKKKVTKLTKLLSGSYWRNPNPPAHCPYLPQYGADSNQWKRPNYWMWLANARNNRVVGAPVQINNLVPVSVYSRNSAKGRRKVKFRFYAPTTQGSYTFTAMLQCDTYLGIDVRQDVKLVVKPMEELEEKERAAQDKNAWKDFEDEEKLERESLLNLANANNEQAPSVGEDAATDSDEDYSSSDDDTDVD